MTSSRSSRVIFFDETAPRDRLPERLAAPTDASGSADEYQFVFVAPATPDSLTTLRALIRVRLYPGSWLISATSEALDLPRQRLAESRPAGRPSPFSVLAGGGYGSTQAPPEERERKTPMLVAHIVRPAAEDAVAQDGARLHGAHVLCAWRQVVKASQIEALARGRQRAPVELPSVQFFRSLIAHLVGDRGGAVQSASPARADHTPRLSRPEVHFLSSTVSTSAPQTEELAASDRQALLYRIERAARLQGCRFVPAAPVHDAAADALSPLYRAAEEATRLARLKRNIDS